LVVTAAAVVAALRQTLHLHLHLHLHLTPVIVVKTAPLVPLRQILLLRQPPLD
jgi:hypothetical protein